MRPNDRRLVSTESKNGHSVLVGEFCSFLSSAGDMYSSEGGEEPDWVKTERQQFFEYRDKNHDGKMDKEETMDWILPSDYDHAEAEAKHLLHESDANQVPLHPALSHSPALCVYLFTC